MRKIADFFTRSLFVFRWWQTLLILAAATMIGSIFLMISRDDTVRTEDASCAVGEIYKEDNHLRIKLSCAESTGVTDTSTGNADILIDLVKRHARHAVCDVNLNGWVNGCRVVDED